MEPSQNAPENDERFAWNTALAAMLCFSLITLLLRLFGMFPFQDMFAVALVGIPTGVLLVGWLATRSSRS